jgi:hypothetical protein
MWSLTRLLQKHNNDLGAWETWQMARNNEKEILSLEEKALVTSYEVLKRLSAAHIGELEPIVIEFHWIADHLRSMSERSPGERKRVRQEISKRTKELSEVVQKKHIQRHLAFSCIDLHDECVRKRKRQKKSPYVCFLALFICLGSSMKGLLAAIAAGVVGGHFT